MATSDVIVNASTVSFNTASGSGGGIYAEYGAVNVSNGSHVDNNNATKPPRTGPIGGRAAASGPRTACW